VAQLKEKFSKVTAKSKVALNRLTALVNLPQAEDLASGEIHRLLARKSTDASTFAIYRKINGTHTSGLADTHYNATLPSTTTDTNLQSKYIPATKVVPLLSLAWQHITGVKLLDTAPLALPPVYLTYL